MYFLNHKVCRKLFDVQLNAVLLFNNINSVLTCVLKIISPNINCFQDFVITQQQKNNYFLQILEFIVKETRIPEDKSKDKNEASQDPERNMKSFEGSRDYVYHPKYTTPTSLPLSFFFGYHILHESKQWDERGHVSLIVFVFETLFVYITKLQQLILFSFSLILFNN